MDSNEPDRRFSLFWRFQNRRAKDKRLNKDSGRGWANVKRGAAGNERRASRLKTRKTRQYIQQGEGTSDSDDDDDAALSYDGQLWTGVNQEHLSLHLLRILRWSFVSRLQRHRSLHWTFTCISISAQHQWRLPFSTSSLAESSVENSRVLLFCHGRELLCQGKERPATHAASPTRRVCRTSDRLSSEESDRWSPGHCCSSLSEHSSETSRRTSSVSDNDSHCSSGERSPRGSSPWTVQSRRTWKNWRAADRIANRSWIGCWLEREARRRGPVSSLGSCRRWNRDEIRNSNGTSLGDLSVSNARCECIERVEGSRAPSEWLQPSGNVRETMDRLDRATWSRECARRRDVLAWASDWLSSLPADCIWNRRRSSKRDTRMEFSHFLNRRIQNGMVVTTWFVDRQINANRPTSSGKMYMAIKYHRSIGYSWACHSLTPMALESAFHFFSCNGE